jgi:hypothetical protein
MKVSFNSNDADKENDYSSDNSIIVIHEGTVITNKRGATSENNQGNISF